MGKTVQTISELQSSRRVLASGRVLPDRLEFQAQIKGGVPGRSNIPALFTSNLALQNTTKRLVNNAPAIERMSVSGRRKVHMKLVQERNEKLVGVLLGVARQVRLRQPKRVQEGRRSKWSSETRVKLVVQSVDLASHADAARATSTSTESAVVTVAEPPISHDWVVNDSLEHNVHETGGTEIAKATESARAGLREFEVLPDRLNRGRSRKRRRRVSEPFGRNQRHQR